MHLILAVEDDDTLSGPLVRLLSKEGYEVVLARNLSEAHVSLAPEVGRLPDLILLDWMLPDGQGIEFLRDLRAKGNSIPVVFLTARSDITDKVLGLELGAHDYVVKPFEPRELVARIRVQLRASMAAMSTAHVTSTSSTSAIKASVAEALAADDVLSASGFEVSLSTREATYCGKQLVLTRLEFSLLVFFLQNENKVFSREELLGKVWGFEGNPTTRTIDTHVLQLRQKSAAELFETIRGVGYRFRRLKQ